jgi:hypothetical protein
MKLCDRFRDTRPTLATKCYLPKNAGDSIMVQQRE